MPTHLKKDSENGGSVVYQNELEGGLGRLPGDAGRRVGRGVEKERRWWIGGTDGFS